MKETVPVVNWAGDYEETCERLAKHLGISKIRRKLFDAIYGRVSKPRSRKQLSVAARLKATDGQQAQNELDRLYRYRLIHRIDNDGSHTLRVWFSEEFVKDGADVGKRLSRPCT